MKKTENREPEDEDNISLTDRKKDLSGLKAVKEQLPELYDAVVKAFEDKSDQNQVVDRAWDVYNCVLNENQAYGGTSKVYIPIVRDAIEARVTRFTNALFPNNGNYADVTGAKGDKPYATISMLNHYVKQCNLRENVVPALIRAGDCCGQYTLFVSWKEKTRFVTRKKKVANVKTDEGVGIDEAGQTLDVEEEEVKVGMPDVQVLDSRDIAIIPANVDDIKDASIVAVALHLTKEGVKERIASGEFSKEAGELLVNNFGATQRNGAQPDTAKKASEAAGVKVEGKNKTALVYMVWSKLEIKGERRWCVTYFASEDNVLSCKRNPYWNDKVPVLSKAVVKIPNSVYGKSRVEPVEKLQYAANDAINMSFDSAQYALLPLVMTDPAKNPRVGSMVMTMAAVWETSPNDTKFVELPQLWKEGLTLVASCQDRIMSSLSVNPAMMPHRMSTKKPSQAEVAQEQQAALEGTADIVTIIECGLLDDLLEWFYDLDCQYRDKALVVKRFGQIGLNAEMEEIPPIEVGTNYVFKWYGTEAVKSAQQVQQQIAAMNVMRGIPPQLLNGRKLDLGPVLDNMAEVAFGPRIAPNVLIDQRHQMSVDPTIENQLIGDNFPVPVNPTDNDQQHIQVHQQALALSGDPTGGLRIHLTSHMQQMSAKAAEAQQQQMPQSGTPGMPGGAARGMPGTPRIGAQPAMGRPVQQPPGAVHQDRMVDPSKMPR